MRSSASALSGASRLVSTSTNRAYHLESSRIDTSLFELPGKSTGRVVSAHSGVGHTLDGETRHDGEEGDDWQPREERRSPAAVFGSKRIGLEVIPPSLEERIRAEMAGESVSLRED